MLEQIGITDANEVANIINTLSHKKVYYFESDELTSDSKTLFDSVFTKIKAKYNFVLHTPKAKDLVEATAAAAVAEPIAAPATAGAAAAKIES